MIGNVVIPEIDALMYVALMAEKYVSFGKIVGTKESIMLQLRHHTN
jgi:hypothetical protein